MKTVKEWLELLPEPYRSKALRNAKQCPWSSIHAKTYSAARALLDAFDWEESPEKHEHWFKLYDDLMNKKISLDAGQPEESTKQTNTKTKTMLDKYSAQAVATVTLVYGTDVSELSAKQCLSAIKANNDEIKSLTESGVTGPYVDQQIAARRAANAALVAQLNTFAAPVAAPVAG